ncbi:MAG: hypothetical protein HQK52_16065 [Oligoflexia bacterium]|nr:hypothetical protein [Oligoflexia bacterium]
MRMFLPCRFLLVFLLFIVSLNVFANSKLTEVTRIASDVSATDQVRIKNILEEVGKSLEGTYLDLWHGNTTLFIGISSDASSYTLQDHESFSQFTILLRENFSEEELLHEIGHVMLNSFIFRAFPYMILGKEQLLIDGDHREKLDTLTDLKRLSHLIDYAKGMWFGERFHDRAVKIDYQLNEFFADLFACLIRKDGDTVAKAFLQENPSPEILKELYHNDPNFRMEVGKGRSFTRIWLRHDWEFNHPYTYFSSIRNAAWKLLTPYLDDPILFTLLAMTVNKFLYDLTFDPPRSGEERKEYTPDLIIAEFIQSLQFFIDNLDKVRSRP